LFCSVFFVLELSKLPINTTVVFTVRNSGPFLNHEATKKRSPEHESLPDSSHIRDPKRPHAENTGGFFHLLQVEKTLAADEEEEEECPPSEELVNGVMRSLEEEIAGTSCRSDPSKFGHNSAAFEISSGHGNQTLASDWRIDLCYLLEASDDELGIPPSPVLNWKNEICQSPKETSGDSWERPDLKCLGESWHFEDDFENYKQFATYENACDASQDYMNRDFISQDLLFDPDFSSPS